MRNYGDIGNTQLIGRINRYGSLGIATFYFLWSCDEEFELNKESSDQLVYPIEIFLSRSNSENEHGSQCVTKYWRISDNCIRGIGVRLS